MCGRRRMECAQRHDVGALQLAGCVGVGGPKAWAFMYDEYGIRAVSWPKTVCAQQRTTLAQLPRPRVRMARRFGAAVELQQRSIVQAGVPGFWAPPACAHVIAALALGGEELHDVDVGLTSGIARGARASCTCGDA